MLATATGLKQGLQVSSHLLNLLSCFFLPLYLNLRRGHQTGFEMPVQRGLMERKEVNS